MSSILYTNAPFPCVLGYSKMYFVNYSNVIHRLSRCPCSAGTFEVVLGFPSTNTHDCIPYLHDHYTIFVHSNTITLGFYSLLHPAEVYHQGDPQESPLIPAQRNKYQHLSHVLVQFYITSTVALCLPSQVGAFGHQGYRLKVSLGLLCVFYAYNISGFQCVSVPYFTCALGLGAEFFQGPLG